MTTSVPDLWEELTNEGFDLGISGLLNIWQNRLQSSKVKNTARPKTILAVTFGQMINLVPQDAAHPLYTPEFEHLTDQFILDHLSLDPVGLKGPGMESTKITLKMMSGRDVVFKREAGGALKGNEIEVEEIKSLSDGTTVVILSDFLFTHYEDTQEAFRQCQPNSPVCFRP